MGNETNKYRWDGLPNLVLPKSNNQKHIHMTKMTHIYSFSLPKSHELIYVQVLFESMLTVIV
jgi:hypothetical protein